MSVFFSLDHSTLQMISYHSETTQHYNETMENLKIINETIVYLLQVPHPEIIIWLLEVKFFSPRASKSNVNLSELYVF